MYFNNHAYDQSDDKTQQKKPGYKAEHGKAYYTDMSETNIL